LLVGEISKSSGRLDQAILQFKKSYELGEQRKIAFQIANLYIDLGDSKNAKNWIAIAAKDAPDDYKIQIAWFEIAILLTEGKRDQAYTRLSELKYVNKPSLDEYYRSTIVNYMLEDYPETISQFEKATELKTESGKAYMSHSAIDAHIYAAYAYQQLEQSEKSQQHPRKTSILRIL